MKAVTFSLLFLVALTSTYAFIHPYMRLGWGHHWGAYPGMLHPGVGGLHGLYGGIHRLGAFGGYGAFPHAEPFGAVPHAEPAAEPFHG